MEQEKRWVIARDEDGLIYIDDNQIFEMAGVGGDKKKFFEDLDNEIEAKIGTRESFGIGYCHYYWAEKKRILREKYGIDWATPAELNPYCIFD